MQPAIYPSLKNKVVYVTGGAGGIGEAISVGFAAQGASVGIVDIDEDAAKALEAKLVALGQNASAVACDLRDIEALRAALTQLKSNIGSADILVNNAAHDQRHTWQDMTP